LALSYSSRGEVLSGQNLLAEALASYDKAISLQPNFSCAWSNRGVVLMDLGRLNEALESFETALSHDSQNIEAWSNRGLALNAMRRYALALESFEMATQLNPRYVEAWSNRGIALHFLNRMEEALASFDQAINLDGNHAEAFCNKGITLTALNRPQEALLCYDAAIAIHPKSTSAHFNKALALLVMGDFQQGWKLYEWRWRLPRARPPDISEPLWLGAESLADCTVLLHGEQGMGDVIQMSRFAKLVADRGAQVTLQVPHPLTDLLISAPGVSRVVSSHTLLPACDFQVPLMSLPLALRTRLDSIPAQVPYLRVGKERLSIWADRLGVQTLRRVGLVWSGDPVHPNDHNRSIAFGDLIRHLPAEFSYVCLQREVRDSDLDLLIEEPRVQFFGYQIEDFSDTAALCSLMDVVVTVDTSVAHLSGALGRPTWILLPFAPDFRWLLNRDDSPWYPTVRLFRQKRIGRWEEPLRSVGHELLKLKPD
jgi:Flp pilus assembly protein TadD